MALRRKENPSHGLDVRCPVGNLPFVVRKKPTEIQTVSASPAAVTPTMSVPPTLTEIKSLVQGFRQHIKTLKTTETKEAAIRQSCIDPFWRALGWDVGDALQRGPQADVLLENNVETAEPTGLHNRAAVEAGSLEELLRKVKRLSPKRRIRTVDRTLYDFKGNEPVDQVFLAHLDVHRRHFAGRLFRQNKPDFPEADTLHGAAKLTEAVQRIMDRLVFMRVCEDRDIVPYGSLRATLERIAGEGGDFYESLVSQFRTLDSQYNGYLYKPHFSESLTLDGAVLADFVRTLYPPDGPWDFAAIGDDILGIVYERFLGNIITVDKGQVDITPKPEVRHAGGVYYTPRFVVDTIIRRVVGPKIAGKTPVEVLDVKVLDPACGSGSFLVAAFQYLIDHCVAAVTADPSLATIPATPQARKKRREIAFRDRIGQWHLAPDFKAALLIRCLHGVDIDQQAVEVTVMSLYLKMLEGALPPHWQREWLENQLLPPLDNNVRCGNSLVDSVDFERYVQERYGGLFPMDEDLRFSINVFDWTSRTRGFGRLLDPQAVKERGRTGFDCIIGNPPYIRVQELNKWAPQECEFYKWRYKSAAKGNYDIYVVFTEKALSLLAPEGLLGFIMPHKFWQARYGEGLRKIIADGQHLQSVVDFGDQQVFKGATTYTAIHILARKRNADGISYARFDELIDGPAQCAELNFASRRSIPGVRRFKADHPGPDTTPFRFADARGLVQVDATRRLDEVADLAQGFKTGADNVFVVELERSNGPYAMIRSQATGQSHTIELASLRPLVKSEHMKPFELRRSTLRLIFPYVRDGSKWRLRSPQEMRSHFPLLWKDYLLLLRPVLRNRERGRFDQNDTFYQFSRPQNFETLSRPKIINPDICQRPQMCWDETGEHVFSGGAAGGVAIVPRDSMNTPLLLGIVNSKLAEYLIRINGTPFRGGYLNCEIRFIRDLPIKLPATAEDKKLAKRITDSVRAIMDVKTKLRAAATPFLGVKGGLRPTTLSDRQTTALEREVEAHEHRIDEAVFALYGVEGLPDE